MEFFDQLDALIRAQRVTSANAAEVLVQMGTPSTSVAFLDHGSISSRMFSTVGDNTETVFQACSISKPVAAMAVMKMVQSGKLRLDAPISEYLSSGSLDIITLPSTRKLAEGITITHLLSHTSGLSQGGFRGYNDERSAVSLQSILSGSAGANTPRVHLSGLPGHRFSYSGGGITVLQLVMEESRNWSLMQRSFYTSPKESDNHASAYYTGFTPCEVPYHVLPEQAAAGVWTTPTDLLKIVRAVQQSLTAKDDSGFLPRSLARQMLTEISKGMALSWLASKNPGTTFGHGGDNNPGWKCFLFGYADLNETGALDPGSEGSGVCIMTNAVGGNIVYEKLLCAIAYLKGWADLPLAPPFPGTVIIPFHAFDTKVDAQWVEWQGSWEGDWHIEARDGAPSVCFQGLPAIRLLLAARPKLDSKERRVIDLVLEGLQIMLRLTEEEDSLVVQIWHGPTGDITTLHKIVNDN